MLNSSSLTQATARLVKEMEHLVRLLEPQEKEGSLDVPGLATLNGARSALHEAKKALESSPVTEDHKIVKDILYGFDFHRVQRFMKEDNWKWSFLLDDTGNSSVPDVTDLREAATRMLLAAIDENRQSGQQAIISSGGLEAQCDNGIVSLRFYIEEVEFDYGE